MCQNQKLRNDSINQLYSSKSTKNYIKNKHRHSFIRCDINLLLYLFTFVMF